MLKKPVLLKKVLYGGVVAALLVAVMFAYAYLRPPVQASGPTEAVPVVSSGMDGSATGAAATALIFEIDQEATEARYVIDEVLGGRANTVVGETNHVAGQIAVDPEEPQLVNLGTILVNARTFTTDDGMRDRAVQNRILHAAEHEFIRFETTSVAGLPAQVTMGESYPVAITGDLTIGGETHKATWEAMLTPVSRSRLEGRATTVIQYEKWNLSIPEVPFVADVDEVVRLELDFAATTQGQGG
jgi:polyisoprenoid-binding protein YceI